MIVTTFAALVVWLDQPAETRETHTPIEPRSLVQSLDGDATEIAVLGTLHLSQLQDFDAAWADPVIDRLAAWQPDLILIESLPAREIEMMLADPAYSDVVDQFAGRAVNLAESAQSALGMTRTEARDALEAGRGSADAASLRRRALLHLANLDPASAAMSWLSLTPAERRAAESLTPALADALNAETDRQNETTAIAARLGHRLGHDRLYAFDSHADKRAFLNGMDDFAAAFQNSEVMAGVMSGPDMAALQAVGSDISSAADLLDALRVMNAPAHSERDIRAQWASFAGADMNGLGRTRVAYWETRNLRMAAQAREIMALHPGGRVLVIVGAAHKPFLDDLFAGAMDTVVVDSQALLD